MINYKKIIYADNAATTKVNKNVINAMEQYWDYKYGNPSSPNSMGLEARKALQSARKIVADCIGSTDSSTIIFTSGGTESNNQAIKSITKYGLSQRKNHIVTSCIEHHSVLNTVKELEHLGFCVTYLRVDENGKIDLNELTNSIKNETCLVSIMTVNNEIGTIQPIREIGAICRNKNVIFHTDAVQALGHIPLNVNTDNIDMLSASAHKFHGPKGCGFLYVRNISKLTNLLSGGKQEFNKRPGTENIPGIIGTSVALQDAVNNLDSNNQIINKYSQLLISNISRVPHMLFNGSLQYRQPGILNFSFEGIEGETLVRKLDEKGICASAGAACSSGDVSPSHVLKAIGRSDRMALGSLRLSISEDNTKDEIDYIINTVIQTVEETRSTSIRWKRMLGGNISFETAPFVFK